MSSNNQEQTQNEQQVNNIQGGGFQPSYNPQQQYYMGQEFYPQQEPQQGFMYNDNLYSQFQPMNNQHFNNNFQEQQHYQPSQGGNNNGGRKKYKKSSKQNFTERVQRNQVWSNKDLKEMLNRYLDVISASKSKTHQLLTPSLDSFVGALQNLLKQKNVAKNVKGVFDESKKCQKSLGKVLIVENDENFNVKEDVDMGNLLKQLKQLKIQSKLGEKELASEFGKYIGALESLNGLNESGGPNRVGDSLSSTLYNLVIAIESLHSILGLKDKFWPQLGGKKSSGSSSSSSKNNKRPKKKKRYAKKKVKVYKKNSKLSADIISSFSSKNATEDFETYNEDEEVDANESKSSGNKHRYKRNRGGKNSKPGPQKKKKRNNKNQKRDNNSGRDQNRKNFDNRKKNVSNKKVNNNKTVEQSSSKKVTNYNTVRQPFGQDGHYVINKKFWKNVEVSQDGSKLELKDRNLKSDAQQWIFEHLGIGFFRIKNKGTGFALTRSDKDLVFTQKVDNSKNQNWVLVKEFFGRRAYYLIFNVEKTKTLIVDPNSNTLFLQPKLGPSEIDAWKIK